MVGGLVLSQAQPHQIATPRTAAPAPAPVPALEKRPRDQAQPCGTAAAVGVSAPRSVDDVRKAHARHIKLGLDRSPRHARPLLAACALSGWPGGMELAASIFESLDDPEAFDYNTIMRGHVRAGRDPAAALRLYADMLEAGDEPDNYTFPFVLKACAQLAALQEGRQLQAHVVKLGFHHDEHVQNSLISLYGKCGEPAMARLVFDLTEAGERTAASWSALLAAYTRAGLWSECLESFGAMVREGWRPDESSMVSALSACAHLGAHDVGRSIHCALLRNAASLNTIMETSLVDMYAKCGSIDKAAAVFDAMGGKNAWAYSAMVSGLALHGDGREALRVFDTMLREGHAPDAAVYVGLLNACSRAGLLDDGLRCFDRMRLEHKVTPNAQHYGCMVDLMARAGRLDDARALIGSMPTGPTATAWRSLLNACRIHGDTGLAENALQELRRLGAANAGDYVIVADMHARAKDWGAAAALRTEAVDGGPRAVPRVQRRGGARRGAPVRVAGHVTPAEAGHLRDAPPDGVAAAVRGVRAGHVGGGDGRGREGEAARGRRAQPEAGHGVRAAEHAGGGAGEDRDQPPDEQGMPRVQRAHLGDLREGDRRQGPEPVPPLQARGVHLQGLLVTVVCPVCTVLGDVNMNIDFFLILQSLVLQECHVHHDNLDQNQ